MFLYVNFSDVSKQNNGGKDIKINGSVGNPSIGDKEVDTDGDGIPDSKDEEKCKFDITADTSNERFIVFNNGKIWHNIGSVLSEFFSAISLNGKSDNENDRKFSQEELKEAVDKVDKNSEQDFGIEELIAIAVYDSEGCRYYTDDLSKAFRERLFKEVTDRDCRYYKHSGILSSSNWKEVPYGTEGGFWKGAVITEADANYSTGANCVFDIYMFIDYAIVVGEILIISLIVMDFAPIVVANMKALAFYIKTFGVKEGIKTFLVLGAANAPNVTNGLVSYLQMDMADGDSSLDDIVEKGGAGTIVEGADALSTASSKVLRQNLIDAGIVVPDYPNAAHHIVAGNAAKAEQARIILQNYGIGINDAANGVFLPTVKDVAVAAYHPSLHTNAYYDEVNNLLAEATSKTDVIEILEYIAESLLNGTFMK